MSVDAEQRTGAKCSFSPSPMPMNLSMRLCRTSARSSAASASPVIPLCRMSLRMRVCVHPVFSGRRAMKSSAMSRDFMSLLYESLMMVHPCFPAFTSSLIAMSSSAGIRCARVSAVMPRQRHTAAHVMAFSIAPSLILLMVNVPVCLSPLRAVKVYDISVSCFESLTATELTYIGTSASRIDHASRHPWKSERRIQCEMSLSSALYIATSASRMSVSFSMHFSLTERKFS